MPLYLGNTLISALSTGGGGGVPSEVLENYYTKEEIDELLTGAPTLVEGKIPLEQIPTIDRVEPDNTLPITSGAVNTVVGNIEALLGTI